MGATDLSVIPGNQVIFPESVFRANTASDIPLTVQGAVSQTANLTEWQTDTGNVRSVVRLGGFYTWDKLQVGELPDNPNQQMLFASTNGSSDVFTIRGAASQAGHLTIWKNSAGGILSHIDSAGGFNTAGQRTIIVGSSGRIVSVQENHSLGTHGFFGGDPVLGLQTTAAARKGLVVRGMASQTGNLVEFQISDGTVRTRVAGDTGALGVNIHPTNIAWLAVTGVNTSDVISVFRGLPSHTGNLTQWQDGAGNVMSSVAGDGRMYLAGDRWTQYGPNSSWGAYLRVGGNNTANTIGSNIAAVAASNGNLHIDCANGGGFGIHLNWYATSTGGVYFGNGAAGQVGRMDGAGAMTAVSFTSTSTLESKREIKRLSTAGPDDDKLMALGAVSYIPVVDPNERKLYSFVAEEVAEVMPEIVSVDENNEITGINLTSLVTILTTQVQNLTARVRELEAR